jgi:hypothetical protein
LAFAEYEQARSGLARGGPRSDSSASCIRGTRNSSIIPTFIVWFPPAVWPRITRDGSTRNGSSSCQSTFSKRSSGANSWMASKVAENGSRRAIAWQERREEESQNGGFVAFLKACFSESGGVRRCLDLGWS